MEASDDDDDDDEDYKDEGKLHDALLRKIRMLCQRCAANKRIIKRLKMDLRFVKISCKANKMSDKDRLRLGWQGG